MNKVHIHYFFFEKDRLPKKRCIWKFGWASPGSWLERGRHREIGGEREMVIATVVRLVHAEKGERGKEGRKPVLIAGVQQ